MYKLTKRRAREFAQLMNQIDEFCEKHNIHQSNGSNTYYFNLNNKAYVVSNRKRTVPEKTRFILAGKTRIIKIYLKLQDGVQLDNRGNEVKEYEN